MMTSSLRQAQRRQILAMMGVTPWVSLESTTAQIDEILAASSTLHRPSSSHQTSLSIDDIQQVASVASEEGRSESSVLEARLIETSLLSPNLLDNASPTVDNNPDYDSDYRPNSLKDLSLAPVEPDAAAVEQPFSIDNPEHHDEGKAQRKSLAALEQSDLSAKIEPFTLQGVGFNGWVLLVDKSHLSEQSQQLWQQIQLGLSLSVDQLSFPFCQSMCTQDMANASLSGFIFKLGRSDQVRVAALTELTQGLDDERLIRLPMLDEMIGQPNLKRQLWQVISKSAN
ncbi:MAG: hypothetical protein Q4P13_02715 [Psychrobacter sp.]|nr:hypothetical protein [Psychrobacter sp.]